MPDISMCGIDECPSSKNCYRHPDSGTKPNSYQSWAGYTLQEGEKNCKSYWPIDLEARKAKK